MIEWFKREPSKLDEHIDKLLEEMQTYSPDTPEYQAAFNHMERLYQLKREERNNRVKADTWVIVGGNLLGIIAIVAYEQAHVITSKATTMLHRAQVN